MWQNTERIVNDSISKDNMNFNNNNNDLNNHQASSSLSIINHHQDSLLYNDTLIKTNNNEIGTQAIHSDYCFPDYHKRKYEYSEQIADHNRSKRGRGRGSRGSYRPRGRARFLNNSVSNSYGVTTQLPRVCVNPEILKILGYQNQSCTDYFYGNNTQLSNNYGLQVVSVDPQTNISQTINQQALGSNISNYVNHSDNNELLLKQTTNNCEKSSEQFYRNDIDKQYFYSQYEACNSNETQEFILEDKLNHNMNEFSSHNNNNNQNFDYSTASNNIIDDQKSILDISRPNQHQHLVEWEAYKQEHNIIENPSPNYENYTTEAAQFMNEIEIIFRNENNLYISQNPTGNTNNIQNEYIIENNNQFLSNEDNSSFNFNNEPFERNELNTFKTKFNADEKEKLTVENNYDSNIIEETHLKLENEMKNEIEVENVEKKSTSRTFFIIDREFDEKKD